ncbi:response regulator, partial [Enterococcus faecalis]|nr:response regulator [Enterococcus faecalis]
MKVAICDDNPTLTEKINTMLFNYNPNIFETYTYYNPL